MTLRFYDTSTPLSRTTKFGRVLQVEEQCISMGVSQATPLKGAGLSSPELYCMLSMLACQYNQPKQPSDLDL